MVDAHGPSARPPVAAAANRFARALYWVSLLMLLSGAYLVIQPYDRQARRTAPIYSTVACFEAYAWLLIGLGAWQARKGLSADAARSGLLAVLVMALTFVAVNELYVVCLWQGRLLSAVLAALAAVKLAVGARLLGFDLPRPFLAAAMGWIALLAAAPAAVAFTSDFSAGNVRAMHAVAYAMFWLGGLLGAAHLGLVGRQLGRNWPSPPGALNAWWAPWLVLSVLAAVAAGQLYAAAYAMDVDVAAWYFHPPLLSAAVVAMSLALARRQRLAPAAALMAIVLLTVVMTAQAPAPDRLPAAWSAWLNAHARHPIYSAGWMLSGLLVLAAFCARARWLLIAAMALAGGDGAVAGTRGLLAWRYGKGALLLVGAFVTLAVAALIQWYVARRSPPAEERPPQPAPAAPPPG